MVLSRKEFLSISGSTFLGLTFFNPFFKASGADSGDFENIPGLSQEIPAIIKPTFL
ncbi:MAG: hypothetical protein P8184_02215 [Calditrichia bacterium]